jgi:hypothetical protein
MRTFDRNGADGTATRYSALSVVIGSTRDARRAGT